MLGAAVPQAESGNGAHTAIVAHAEPHPLVNAKALWENPNRPTTESLA